MTSGQIFSILITDDDPAARETLREIVAPHGFRTLMAESGEEAIDLARQHEVHLALMDMHLPVLDGWEVTRRLKADRTTRLIPVIALTAHALVGDRAKVLLAGCDDYDTKPVDLPRLLAKIETLLGDEATI